MKIVILLCGASLAAQTRTFPLESLEGLKLHHVAAAPLTHQGRKAIRVTEAPGALTSARTSSSSWRERSFRTASSKST